VEFAGSEIVEGFPDGRPEEVSALLLRSLGGFNPMKSGITAMLVVAVVTAGGGNAAPDWMVY
jgi:hypothetical protein